MPLTFKNFTAAARKANMPFFGMATPSEDLSWIENHMGAAPTLVTVAETPDGDTVDFTLPDIPANGLMLFNNGIYQYPNLAYTISGAVISFLPGYVPQTDDQLITVTW